MTIFLLIMVFVAGTMGFLTCALCQAAAEADRENERLFAEWQRTHEKEADA